MTVCYAISTAFIILYGCSLYDFWKIWNLINVFFTSSTQFHTPYNKHTYNKLLTNLVLKTEILLQRYLSKTWLWHWVTHVTQSFPYENHWSVTKSLHQYCGLCYLHLLVFFFYIHSSLLRQNIKLWFLLFLSKLDHRPLFSYIYYETK